MNHMTEVKTWCEMTKDDLSTLKAEIQNVLNHPDPPLVDQAELERLLAQIVKITHDLTAAITPVLEVIGTHEEYLDRMADLFDATQY